MASTGDLKGVLFGLGNPLLDVSAKVDPSLLAKYNLKSNDAILADETHIPLYKELVDQYEVDYVAGGSAQNTLRGAQTLLPEDSTMFVGCVGTDPFAQELRVAARKDGLTVDYLLDEQTPTGVCGLLITGHDRSMVTNLQAANKYQASHLQQPSLQAALHKARYFYVEGFFLTVSPDSILTLAKHAAEHNKVFAMNLSAPFLCQFFREPMDTSSQYWDFIFGNELEAAAWAEHGGHKTEDLREIALLLANLPKVNKQRKRHVLITQGADATLLAVEGQTSVEEVQVFSVSRVPSDEIEDTNGAGDAFVGGFLSQLVLDKPLSQCVDAGHFLAGQVIRLTGAQYPRNVTLP